MLTIFTIPKDFKGHNNIIQRNAIKSWLKLEPSAEIILMGNDDGVGETAHELNVQHVPFIEKNKYGTPLLNSAFIKGQQIAKHDTIMYINSDIIIFQDMIDAVQKIHHPHFLVCGRRWDLDVNNIIDFSTGDWSNELHQRIMGEGQLHGRSGIDYFIFKRHSVEMPPFAVGRPGWDGWLIYEMRRKHTPVIDASEAISIIHQNHDYSHSCFGEKKRVGGPEWQENILTAGGLTNMLTLRDADWVLTKDGVRRPSFNRRLFSLLSLWYTWRMLLAAKRKIYYLMSR